jgi:putative addiction module component (TIGR02574 family)
MHIRAGRIKLRSTNTGEPAMPATLEEIQTEAMKLSAEERAELADRLWASLEPQADIDAAWDAEIERRLRQLEAGEVETIPHETVIAELRAKYG